jgi:hypothetical protein
MTFGKAIEIVKKLTPSMYSDDELRRWLMLCETQIYDEIVLTHAGACCRSRPTGEDCEELIVPEHMAEDVYINFLQARIAKENAENVKYNQSIGLFNDAYTRFARWYNERFRPLPSGSFLRI